MFREEFYPRGRASCNVPTLVLPSLGIAAHPALDSLRGPSLVTWRRIVAALDAETDHEGLDAALTAVDAACAGIPDKIRLAPGRWVRKLLDRLTEPRLRVCRALDLTLHDVDLPGDRLAWTDAPELAHLRILRVSDDRFGDGGLERWLRSSNNLRPIELALGGGITDRGARLLAADSRLLDLESLAVFRNRIGPEGLAALIGSPKLARKLRRLLLGRNLFGEAGARALTGETTIEDLALLDLDCNRLDGAAMRALVHAPLLSGVRTLNLSNNPIGAEGCAALSTCPNLDKLEVLLLHDCQLDDDAVAPLLEGALLSRLKNLALSANSLSMKTVERIASRGDFCPRELDICHNRFHEAEADVVLRCAPLFTSLRRLCL